MKTYHYPYTREYLTRHPTHFENEPRPYQDANLRVMSYILYHLSSVVGRQLIVDSCFRSPQVNSVLGGARLSFHCIGSAVDILTVGLTENELHTLYRAIDNFYPAEFVVHPRHIHVAFDISRLGNVGSVSTWQKEFPSEFPPAEFILAEPGSDL